MSVGAILNLDTLILPAKGLKDAMVTKLQYDTLREAYLEEEERYKQLGTAANVFLSIETFFLGSLFFKLETVLTVASKSTAAHSFLIATWVLFFSSLVCTARVLFVRDFEAPFHPKEVLQEIDKQDVNDEDFIARRTVQVVIATENNIKMNDTGARWLQFAGYFLLAGFAAAIVFLILATFLSVDFGAKT